MDGDNMAVRLMYLKYDHLSEQCKSYHLHGNVLCKDLLNSIRDEWRTKLKYKYVNWQNEVGQPAINVKKFDLG